MNIFHKVKQKPLGGVALVCKYCHKQFTDFPLPEKHIKVIGGAVNCETTVEACTLCGQHLTEPNTDC